MKRLCIFIMLSLLCGVAMTAHAEDSPFLVQHTSPRSASVARRIIQQSCSLRLQADRPVCNLSISGSVSLPSDTSLVRVVLEDTEGGSWLVFEATQMLTNRTTVSFTDYGEETTHLCGVTPRMLKVYVRDAALTLANVTVDTCKVGVTYAPLSPNAHDLLRTRQVQVKADSINAYNRKNGILWRAGVTSLAKSSFAERQSAMLQEDPLDTSNFEYYVEGIFEEGSASTPFLLPQQDGYVNEFSWCNRHGENWVTPVRDQQTTGSDGKRVDSNYCWAFATTAQIEALFNLYYNRHMDLDLAEEDVAMHSGERLDNGGAYPSSFPAGVAKYLKNTGVALETAVPLHQGDYVCQPRPGNLPSFKIPDYTPISSRTFMSNSDIPNIKHNLIHHGPMATTILGHAMLLVGYKILKAGDVILYEHDSMHDDTVRIKAGDDRIGQTCWIFKNSYGTNDIYSTAGNGYMNVVYKNLNTMVRPMVYNIPPSVTFMQDIPDEITDSLSVKCTDKDGDGYYNWGIGPRPSSLPAWAEAEEDSDDSDPGIGPMDEYGMPGLNLYNPSDTIFIVNDTEIEHSAYFHKPVVIRNGAVLTVSNTVKGAEGTTVFLEDNSRIQIRNSGKIEGIMVRERGTGDLSLKEKGQVNISRSSNAPVSLKRKSRVSIQL